MYIDTRNKPAITPISKRLKPSQQTEETLEQQPLQEAHDYQDRRVRPDRRRRQEKRDPKNERRKRVDRRMPDILNAKDGSPEKLPVARGRVIDIQA